MQSATAFLPMSSASIRYKLCQAKQEHRKTKKHSSLSSKLELKGLVKPETASSIRISYQCIEEVFQFIEL